MLNDFLQQDIMFLQGVGPKKAELLAKELSIYTIEDLLYYFPFKYIDRSVFHAIKQLNQNLAYVQIKGQFKQFSTVGEGYKKRLVAQFVDESGSIEIVWFKAVAWASKIYKKEIDYVIFGKPNFFNGKINFVHPEIEEAEKTSNVKLNATLQASYNTTEKMKKGFLTSRAISKLQENIRKSINTVIPETMSAYLVEKLKLISINEALRTIHFPENTNNIKKAEYRLKFEELFYIQLNIFKQKNNRKVNIKSYIFQHVGEYFNQFYTNNLPFELTGAQKRVLKEIRKDLGSSRHCNRLLQGDVGSGKTLVALMSMLLALDNDYQACLMAPTEILAQQHFITIQEFLKGLNIEIEILTGSSKTKKRRVLHQDLSEGKIQIIIGTHALLEDVVQFKNLGLVIIDEQHRFGVAQRARLWKKNNLPPHVIVMTATPIPRTLAMTVYGDLEMSVIDELPPGRKKIKTIHAFDSKRLGIFKFIREEIEKGRQIYIVYPLIAESEHMDYKDLEDGYESISRAFPSPKYAVSVVHGKMKAAEKEKAMQLFANGQTQIMVATTVIEVGVNVPNASVMIIESAERFGLSQLHQLRGRVGRGAEQSYCVLMTSYKLSKDSRTRIDTMVSTTDGFLIAEVDLKLRGPGDLEGTQQSGISFDLKIANLLKDSEILQHARHIANKIIEDDPKLEKEHNLLLEKQRKRLFSKKVSWGQIS